MKKKRLNQLMPDGVPRWIRCYDNGGRSWDRYTVCYTGRYRKPFSKELQDNGYYGKMEWFQYVGMDEHPFHPQGFGQHGESRTQIDVNKSGFAPAIGRKNHLGKRIPFSELPPDCRKLVISDYKEIWNL